MKTFIRLFVFLAFTFFVSAASAHDYKKGELFIEHPWSRPAAAGVKTGVAYLSIRNDGNEADRLISVKTEASNAAELHSTTKEGDVMKMRKIEKGVELPPGATVKFEPGGLHIMLIGLKQPLDEGRSFPLTLVFEKAGEAPVEVKIESKPASAKEEDHDEHSHH